MRRHIRGSGTMKNITWESIFGMFSIKKDPELAGTYSTDEITDLVSNFALVAIIFSFDPHNNRSAPILIFFGLNLFTAGHWQNC